MTLTNGDQLTKSNGEAYVASAVFAANPTIFNANLTWVNPPPPPSGPPPLHVFNPQGSPLVDAFTGLVFGNDFQTMDDAGEKDCYEVCWVVSDLPHAYLLVVSFQQNLDGTHQVVQNLYQKGALIQTSTTPVLANQDGSIPAPVKAFGLGDTVQFFLNKDRTVQIFWYRNGPIVFGQNNAVPLDFTPTDITVTLMPMELATRLTFAGLNAQGQNGQIFNDGLQQVPVIHSTDAPFAVVPAQNPTNAIYTFTQPHPDNNAIDFTLTSP